MKVLLVRALMVLAVFFMVSCGGQNKSMVYNTDFGRTNESEAIASVDHDVFQAVEPKKMVYNAFLTLVVATPETAKVEIEKIATKYNGYMNQTSNYSVVIFVRQDQLELAIADIGQLGKLSHKNIYGKDVTDEYRDYSIRLENAEQSRKKYLKLLDDAENVEAALKVEKELERLNETIDLLKGKINQLDHVIAYSEIRVNIKEHKKPGLLGYIGIGVYHAVKWLFVRN